MGSLCCPCFSVTIQETRSLTDSGMSSVSGGLRMAITLYSAIV